MTSETRSQGAQAPQQLPRFGYFFLFCVLSLVSASSEPDFGADDASSGDAWIDFAHHDPYQGTFVFPNGFPAQNGECFENVRDKSHSLDDREHGCPILSQPEGTECASQRRVIYCCDFPRIAAGKTIFLHLGPPQRSPHRR